MKKIINLVITGCLIFALLIPQVAFAAVGGEEAEWQDIVLSDEEFEEILSNNPDNQIMPLSSDLINRHSIAIQKNGNSLIIAEQLMAHQKFQNVDLQKFQYNEEVTAVHLGAIIKHILICTTTVINIFYQKAFLSQVDINMCYLHTLC